MSVGAILADFARFATFRPLRGDVPAHMGAYLIVGLLIVWIVGIGRTWDVPDMPLIRKTGLGSVIYALALALFITLIVAPLRPARWRYENVLLMVTMTAAPGLIYAIPIEMFMPAGPAAGLNLIFLLIVAGWRMALYLSFLLNVAKLPTGATIVALMLPPTIIIAAISVAGAMDAIAHGMGGVRTAPPPGAISEEVLSLMAQASWGLLMPLLVAWFALIVIRNRRPGSSA